MKKQEKGMLRIYVFMKSFNLTKLRYMYVYRLIFALIIWAALFAPSLLAQKEYEDYFHDYDPNTGLGCLFKEPITEYADFHILCISDKRDTSAVDAALFKAQLACKSEDFLAYDNLDVFVPIKWNRFGAQIEVRCVR